MPFYAIAAMSENRVIGEQGKIPWHLAEDFRWFKHKTMGGTLVMGRKTFESIGKPLPGRKTIILSWQPNAHTELHSCTFKSFFDEYIPQHLDETYWIAGGGEVYREFLDHCQYLYLTTVKRMVRGDVHFPSAEQVEKSHEPDQLIHECAEFRVERWKQKIIPPQWILPPEIWPFPPRGN